MFPYFSDLEKYKDLSSSRTSLSGRMGSIKKSAQKGFSKLRRAISLERVDKSEEDQSNDTPGRLKKSPSITSLRDKLPFRRKSSDAGQSQRPNSARNR